MKKHIFKISIAIDIILLSLLLYVIFFIKPKYEMHQETPIINNEMPPAVQNQKETIQPPPDEVDAEDDTADTNDAKIKFNDPDFKKAFPDNLGDLFKAQAQTDFVFVSYADKNVPNSLIKLMEKALSDKNLDNLDLGTAAYEISIDEFYLKYGYEVSKTSESFVYSKEDFYNYVRHIYKYSLYKHTYYLLVVHSGGTAGFVENYIYVEENGELFFNDAWAGLDSDARVIQYEGELYFIEQSYNYNSKAIDTIYIYKLVSDQVEDFLAIKLLPEKYSFKNIYDNRASYGKAVADYVDSIKEDLMAKSSINDDIEIYSGDEAEKFDQDRQLMMESAAYGEVDFNNDGEPEYIWKRFWFPSNSTLLTLENGIYKLTDNSRILLYEKDQHEIGPFGIDKGDIIQLWFKKIGDQVFTFRLFLYDGYDYFLNVSLIEGTDVTQVQSYMVVPESGFKVKSFER